MALRSKIQAFESGGVSNLTPNSKRKRSLYDAEVDQKIDLFESLKGQEERYRRLGPMYRRFGNLKQKLEADLRNIQASEEDEGDKENAGPNRAQPDNASRPSTPKAKEVQRDLLVADDLPDVVSMEEAAMNAARVAELEDTLRTLQHKYKARKKQVHTIKKQKLDLESLVSAQREEHKRHIELQQKSEEEVRRLQELNKFLSEGYEDVKEEMRKKAVLIRSKVLRDELRRELEDKRKLREEMREKQRTTINGDDDDLPGSSESDQHTSASPSQSEKEDGEEAKQAAVAAAAAIREEERKRMAQELERDILERVRAEFEREKAQSNDRLKAAREEREQEAESRLARERAEWERKQAEIAQQAEEETQRRHRELKRKREAEFDSHIGALRGDNEVLSREIREKEEELQLLRSDVVVLQEAIENMQQEMTLEVSEWERMKACLEKEVHRAYKELKSKEERHVELQSEISSLKDELQRVIALAHEQQSRATESECQYCGGGKRIKVDVTPEDEDKKEERSVPAERATPTTPMKEATTPNKTPVRTQMRRPASVVLTKRTSETKAAAAEKDLATKEAKEERAAKRRSQVTSVGTPRPAASKHSSSRATLAGREKSAIASLGSSSSATSSSSSSSSPLRRASLAPTTPRKGSVREKSAVSAIASSTSSVATASPRRRERASSVFASQTPRFDTKLDPLRYEKLAGGSSSTSSNGTTQ